jgi:hypothetical protein
MKIKTVQESGRTKYFRFDEVSKTWLEVGFSFIQHKIHNLVPGKVEKKGGVKTSYYTLKG